MDTRLSRLPPERRAQILAAIVAEIADHGLDGASVAGIARRAGGSKASLFYYFDDREAMILAAATSVLDDVLGSLPGDGSPLPLPAEPGAFWAAFEAMYLEMAARLSSEPVRARFARVWIEAMARGAVPPSLLPLADRLRRLLSDLVTAGLASGALRSDVPRPLLERALFGLALGADAWLTEAVQAGEPADRAAKAVLSLVRSGFAAPGARPVKGPFTRA